MSKKDTVEILPYDHFCQKYGAALVNQEGKRLVAVGTGNDDEVVIPEHLVLRDAYGLIQEDGEVKALGEIEVDCAVPGCGGLKLSKKDKKGKKTGNAKDAFVVSGFKRFVCNKKVERKDGKKAGTHREFVATWWSKNHENLNWNVEDGKENRLKRGLIDVVVPALSVALFRRNRRDEVQRLVNSILRNEDESIQVFSRDGLLKAFKTVKIEADRDEQGHFCNFRFDPAELEAVAEGLSADQVPLSCKKFKNGFQHNGNEAEDRRPPLFYYCCEFDAIVEYENGERKKEKFFFILCSPNANVARKMRDITSRYLASSLLFHRRKAEEEKIYADVADNGGEKREKLVLYEFGKELETKDPNDEDCHYVKFKPDMLDYKWLARQCSDRDLIFGGRKFTEEEIEALTDDPLSLVTIIRGKQFRYVIMERDMARSFANFLTNDRDQYQIEYEDGKKKRVPVKAWRLSGALPWLKNKDEQDRMHDLKSDETHDSLDNMYGSLFPGEDSQLAMPDGPVDQGRTEQRGGRKKEKKPRDERLNDLMSETYGDPGASS